MDRKEIRICESHKNSQTDGDINDIDAVPGAGTADAAWPDRGPCFFPLSNHTFLGFFTIVTPYPFIPSMVMASVTTRALAACVAGNLNDAKVGPALCPSS